MRAPPRRHPTDFCSQAYPTPPDAMRMFTCSLYAHSTARDTPLSVAAYSLSASRTLGTLQAWQPPTASPGFSLRYPSRRVRSATTVICGIIVELDGSEPRFREGLSRAV